MAFFWDLAIHMAMYLWWTQVNSKRKMYEFFSFLRSSQLLHCLVPSLESCNLSWLSSVKIRLQAWSLKIHTASDWQNWGTLPVTLSRKGSIFICSFSSSLCSHCDVACQHQLSASHECWLETYLYFSPARCTHGVLEKLEIGKESYLFILNGTWNSLRRQQLNSKTF